MAIPRFLLQNIGSLIYIEYVPAFAISTFSISARGVIASGGIALAAGYAWSGMYCSPDTMGYQQDQVNDNNGQSFAQQVVGFIPGDETAIEIELLKLNQVRFVCRVTLPNGTLKIVGSRADPLEFIIKSNTQTTTPGRSGTDIGFSGKTANRSLFVTG
jgi:hypothetical protein